MMGMYNYGFARMFTAPYVGGNKYLRNFRRIEKRLESKGINASVCHHDAFGVEYYLLKCKDFYGSSKKIADALNIPKDWVDFICMAGEDTTVFYLKRNEFNKLYCDSNGELKFTDYENLQEAFDKCNVDFIKDYFSNILNIDKKKVFVHVGMKTVEICLENPSDSHLLDEYGKYHHCNFDDYIIIITYDELKEYKV